MELIHRNREVVRLSETARAVDETFVFHAQGRGTVTLRARDKGEGFKLAEFDAIASGPDVERELAIEAWTVAREMLRSRPRAAAA